VFVLHQKKEKEVPSSQTREDVREGKEGGEPKQQQQKPAGEYLQPPLCKQPATAARKLPGSNPGSLDLLVSSGRSAVAILDFTPIGHRRITSAVALWSYDTHIATSSTPATTRRETGPCSRRDGSSFRSRGRVGTPSSFQTSWEIGPVKERTTTKDEHTRYCPQNLPLSNEDIRTGAARKYDKIQQNTKISMDIENETGGISKFAHPVGVRQ
jgi:hypothetical protein